ncbi:DUF2590 family protein [Rheinheimera marina]|uniref:DUF2590 family protein n=1 Tax=Rheinheimera marina TaxID=1774958 RepID=A0ABV9JJS8_9GAMM
MEKYSDLFIEGGGLAMNSISQPDLIHSRASIAQDVKHRLLESGLVTKLLAQRSSALRNDVFTEMELLIETDTRLRPGTIEITEQASGRVLITAETYEFGSISTEVITNATNS